MHDRGLLYYFLDISCMFEIFFYKRKTMRAEICNFSITCFLMLVLSQITQSTTFIVSPHIWFTVLFDGLFDIAYIYSSPGTVGFRNVKDFPVLKPASYCPISTPSSEEKIHCFSFLYVFPSGSVIKNPPTKQEMWFNPWVGDIPQRRKWQPTPVFLPGKSHGQWSLAGYRP